MALMPPAITAKSPRNFSTGTTTSISPRSCSADMWFIAAISPTRLPRSVSIVSLMKAFLPGNASSGASKLPSPNSLTQAIAFFFTAMWPATIVFTPCAITARSPWKPLTGMTTSMSPRSCSADMRAMPEASSPTGSSAASSSRLKAASTSAVWRVCPPESSRRDRSPRAKAASRRETSSRIASLDGFEKRVSGMAFPCGGCGLWGFDRPKFGVGIRGLNSGPKFGV